MAVQVLWNDLPDETVHKSELSQITQRASKLKRHILNIWSIKTYFGAFIFH